MRTVDLIMKKRNGHALSKDEIDFLIAGYTAGDIPDYQMSAWTMAIYFQGMNAEETAYLTMALVNSGDQINPDKIPGIFVDKHSTGGVGDKTTLVVAPLVSAAGVSVAKMSGRGLGHTGGTIDKLEAIPGFQVELTPEQFFAQVAQIGIAIVGQSGDMTPADKRLYGLRDVTATVESIPLIAASIMSKKIASGAKAIVLDVKTGNGAFMKTVDESIALAQAMVAIGTQVGRKTVALISDMNQPLGHAIGNANEVIEAIETLKGQGPTDLMKICLALGSQMLILAGKAADQAQAEVILRELIISGKALSKFQELILQQGGNQAVIEDYSLFSHTAFQLEIRATQMGIVTHIDAEHLGLAAMLLGAGRETKQSSIDYGVGIQVHMKVGSRVQASDLLATLHYNSVPLARLHEAELLVQQAFEIENSGGSVRPLLYAIVDENGVHRI